MKPVLHAQIVWGSLPENRSRIPGELEGDVALRTENRKERRYTVDQPAQILSTADPGSIWNARIRDISSRGMQLSVDEPVAAGPDILIRWHGRDVTGVIRYNHRCDGKQYRIGVELCPPSDSLMVEMLASQSEQLQQAAAELDRHQSILSQYVTLLDLASDALIVTALEGTVRFWNKAAERLYGWTRDEAVGRHVNGLFESGMTAGAEISKDLRHTRKDGSSVRVKSCSIVQPDSSGRPAAILLVNREMGR